VSPKYHRSGSQDSDLRQAKESQQVIDRPARGESQRCSRESQRLQWNVEVRLSYMVFGTNLQCGYERKGLNRIRWTTSNEHVFTHPLCDERRVVAARLALRPPSKTRSSTLAPATILAAATTPTKTIMAPTTTTVRPALSRALLAPAPASPQAPRTCPRAPRPRSICPRPPARPGPYSERHPCMPPWVHS
jgi:hypothetical protein